MMKQTTLNEEVLDLFRLRARLMEELNTVEGKLSAKRRLLIQFREVETAAHDVRHAAERRASCAQ
jgi:hypothetical protein